MDPLKVKALERNTLGEQEVDVHLLGDEDVEESELLELGEKKRGGGMNLC